tara:strand:+ start:129 stop:1112 length:984 start_codon:yes stop_codon:yes gene_type:complete
MKKILVTGGAGFIGSKVCYDLLDKNYKIVVIDNLSNSTKENINKKIIFYNCDLKNIYRIDKIFQKHKFDAVFHFAALTNVSESSKYRNKYYLNNVVVTKNILNLIKKFKIKYFVFSSSAAVYGNIAISPVHENNKIRPISNYGKNKAECEVLIKNFSSRYDFNYAILRYFNVIGADFKLRTGQLSKGSLFKNLANNLANNKYSINIYGKRLKTKDGTPVRDYIDINDLSSLHILALKKLIKKKSLLINCGYNKGYTVLEIVKEFSEVIKKDIKIKFLRKRLDDISQIYCSNKRLLKIFPNWKRKYFIKDSIRNMLNWEKKIKKNFKF